MTYQDLLTALQELDPGQLAQDVTIESPDDRGYLYPATLEIDDDELVVIRPD